MVCSYCVFIMSDDSKYCPKCGRPTPLVGEAADVIRTPQEAYKSPASLEAATESPKPAPSPFHPVASPTEIERKLSSANVHRLRKEWDKAAEDCAAILEAEPSNPVAHSLLGDICKEQDKLEDARRWYRMATALRPSASDEAKLKSVEEALAKKRRGGTQVLNQRIALPVHADGSVVSGTTRLAGVSPRKWLRAITLVSVAFMGITVVALGAFQMGKRQNGAAPKQFVPATSAPSPAALPSQRPISTPAPITTPPSVPPNSEGGTGFAPDRPANGTIRPQPSPNPVAPKQGGESSALPGLNPAAVLSVMERPTAIQLKAPDEGDGDATRLPGGMWIANIQRDAKLPQAIVEIGSSLKEKEPLTEDQKRLILRNVYRAAERVAKSDATLKALGFMVMGEGEKPSEKKPLLLAEMATKSLANLDIENAAAPAMQQALRDHKWASELNAPPAQSAAAPPKTPPAQPASPKPYVYIELAPTKN